MHTSYNLGLKEIEGLALKKTFLAKKNHLKCGPFKNWTKITIQNPHISGFQIPTGLKYFRYSNYRYSDLHRVSIWFKKVCHKIEKEKCHFSVSKALDKLCKVWNLVNLTSEFLLSRVEIHQVAVFCSSSDFHLNGELHSNGMIAELVNLTPDP